MTDADPKDRSLDDDLEREIAEALGEESLLGIGRKRGASARPPEPLADTPEAGKFCDATIAGVGTEDVFVAFGPREQGVIPADQFSSPPDVGETVRVYVERYDPKEGLYLCGLKRALQAAAGWDTVEVGAVVNATIRAVNKGGLDVQVGFLSGFLPASHAALERIEDLSVLVGVVLPVEVIEADPDRRRLVVSRRAVLARQRDERRQDAVERLASGQVLDGTVTRVEKFGAFVDIGGVEGLVHVSQLDWKRVQDPADVVKPGDVVKVQVLEIEEEGRRIRLGMKQLKEDPWIRFIREHPPGSIVEGTVTRLQAYGAFVEVADGIEGLAHVSRLSPMPVGHPREIVHAGQTIGVRVVDIEPERRRISLSLLTERGDRLTDDVADDDTIREVLERTRDEAEPTLGDLLKRALGERPPS
jgi:small subunit ribosomal protein S1